MTTNFVGTDELQDLKKLNPIVAILGETATGKSALGLWLASQFNGEIINADSRQVYRGMDIGTNKPTLAEQASIRHHLLNIVDPDEEFSLAQFLPKAHCAINEIISNKKLPIVVGGTGQYLWGLLEGWLPPKVPPDLKLRHSLGKILSEKGAQALYVLLQNSDPIAAKKIHPNNTRRIIRALEVQSKLGITFSKAKQKSPIGNPILIIGVTAPNRNELYRWIDVRLKSMLNAGWMKEVQDLIDAGYSLDLPSLTSLGYRDLAKFIRGKHAFVDMMQNLQRSHRRLSRQQRTWFKLNDSRIHWIIPDKEGYEHANRMVQRFIL